MAGREAVRVTHRISGQNDEEGTASSPLGPAGSRLSVYQQFLPRRVVGP